ncbi:MAG: DDE_Tnp_1-associated, partial [Candidatus Kentron sp. G]
MNTDLVSILSTVKDPRTDRNKLYPLPEILLLCISAVLSGADGWKSIAEFGHTKLDWLRKFLEFKNGIPSEDCIAWVIARLDSIEFQKCFTAWTKSTTELTDGEVVAMDGKTLRGSHDSSNDRSAIHVVSAWAAQNHLSLGQITTEEKSNEITAIPKLL